MDVQMILRKNKKTIGCAIVFMAIGMFAFMTYGYAITKTVRYLILIAALVLLAKIDQEQQIVPNKIIIILMAVRGLILLLEVCIYRSMGMVQEQWTVPILGMCIGGGIFLAANAVTRGGIGMGDVKLFMVIGFYVGSSAIFPAMILSLLFMAVYGIIMMSRKKLTMKNRVPFVPFIAAGTIFTLLLGF